MNSLLDVLDASIDSTLPLPRKIWANWDAHPGSREPGAVVWFRTPLIDAAGLGGNLTLYVSGNGPYTLRVGEEAVAPASKSEPAYWRFDVYDLTEQLRRGPARLTFQATASVRLPFLLCCVDATLPPTHPDAPRKVVRRWVSDASFEVSVDGGTTWAPAWAFEGVWAEPYGFAEGGPDDFARLTHGRQRVTHQHFAATVAQHHGIWRWESHSAGGPLKARVQTMEMWRPSVAWDRVNQTMYHLLREDYCRVYNEWMDQDQHRLPWVLLDAGRETFGRVILRNAGRSRIQVAVVTGETVNETHYYNRRMGVTLSLEPGERATTPLIAFRYAKIHAIAAADGEFVLAEPLLQKVEHPVRRTGSFRCSDETLNRIWELGAETLLLCCQNEIWDAPKRDLLPWMGDLHIESLIYLHCFEDPFLVRRSLQANRETGPALGRPFAERLAPSLSECWGGPAHDVNGMPSYTAWWVLGLCDYYLHTGDTEYPSFEAAELETLLDHLAKGVTPEGWRFGAYHVNNDFVDHTVMSRGEADAAMGAICAAAFRRAADLLEALGRTGGVARYRSLAQTLDAGYWQWIAAQPMERLRHHAASPAVALGNLDAARRARLFDGCLAVPDDQLMSPWWRGYDLLAGVNAGRIPWVLDEIRRRWTVMVGHGQTSLWECADPRWFETDDPHACAITREDSGYGGYRMSCCHGWSGGPTVALIQGVLGVRPLEPGFRRVTIRPELGDLEWAEGCVPTPQGAIRVAAFREGGEVRIEREVPNTLQVVTG